MNAREHDVWSGLERRLRAVERLVPDAPPWRSPSETARIGDGGIRLGPTLSRPRDAAPPRPVVSRRGVWALLVAGALVAIVVGGLIAGGIGPRPDADLSRGPFGPTGLLRGSDSTSNVALLPDGRVLIMNGTWKGFMASSIPEVWDPTTGKLSRIGSTVHPRVRPTATLLLDGRVLVVGGFGGQYAYSSSAVATAELWDPATGSFVETGAMAEARVGHTATLLADGRVLVVGGAGPGTDNATAEVWDPESGQFAAAGRLTYGRSGHAATLLLDGRVLVGGGVTSEGARLGERELWDPQTSRFETFGFFTDRPAMASWTRLTDGRVLLVGGLAYSGDGSPFELAFFAFGQPAADRVPAMSLARFAHAAVLLPDGRVVILGGTVDGGESTASVEVFDPATETFDQAPSLPSPVRDHTATLLIDGRILVVGPPGGPEEQTVDVYTLGSH
jgi:hypothetical protein